MCFKMSGLLFDFAFCKNKNRDEFVFLEVKLLP